MSRAAYVVAGVVAAGVAVAAASAQQPMPTVAVTVDGRTVDLQGVEALPAGPTRFDIRKTGSQRDREVNVAALHRGVTLDQLSAALARGSEQRILRLIRLEAGGGLLNLDRRRVVTVTLKPATTYVVIESAGSSSARWPTASFTTTGATNAVPTPAPKGTVRMVDYRFEGPRSLPRNGVIRVDNAGRQPHLALAFPLARRATSRAVGRALRSGSQDRFFRYVAHSPTELQPLLSGGAVDEQQMRFRYAGRYALVCFFGNHARRGMYRVVTVR